MKKAFSYLGILIFLFVSDYSQIKGINIKNKKQSELEKGYKSMKLDTRSDINDNKTLLNPFRVDTSETIPEEIIIVFKSHFDIGYTHLASEVVQGYRTTTIDHALDVVDQNRNLPADQQFVWTIPGWPMKKILEDWQGQTQQRKIRVHEAFKEGRFVVHALPFTMQTEMMEPEGLVRGLGFSSRLARESGKPLPKAAKMTDVPEHSWILPTILKNAGVEFLHLGCNGSSSPPVVPLLFWWEGPDGSRILTMYSTDYGSGLFPPEGWKHKTWLAMLMRGDNEGPPNPDEVKKIINEIHIKYPNIKVKVGQLSDFSDRILKENPDLPVIKSDMPDTWIHGVMCEPAGVKLARETMPSLFATECLHSLLDIWGIAPNDISKQIADAYENSILFYEHTWGGAMYWVAKYLPPINNIGQCDNWNYGDKWKKDLEAGRFKRSIASWEEHSDYARTANHIVMPLMKEEMLKLARSVKAKGERTVVFNPLPWQRDGIPSMGYKTFLKGQAFAKAGIPSIDKTKGIIENKYFRITADPAKGSISSIIEKSTGKELVDVNAPQGFAQLLYERFSAKEVAGYNTSYLRGGYDWGYVELGKPNMPDANEFPYRAYSPVNCKLSTQLNGNIATLSMDYQPEAGKLSYPVTTQIILNGDANYIDFEITVDKPADPWPEAGWICFPFKVDKSQFRVGRNGSVIDPVKDINVEGVNRYLYAVGTGVAVFDKNGKGAGVCGTDAPLVSLGMPGDWKFDKDYVPQKPYVYYNLFNNHWSTNYRFWNEGKWTYRFRIWTFDKYNNAESLINPSFEARYPLQVVSVDAEAGNLPKENKGIDLSRKGVIVTAFGNDPDGNKSILLRLWEQAGISAMLDVTLPKGMKVSYAVPVNLRGEKTGNPIKISDNIFGIKLNAYSPASFILQ